MHFVSDQAIALTPVVPIPLCHHKFETSNCWSITPLIRSFIDSYFDSIVNTSTKCWIKSHLLFNYFVDWELRWTDWMPIRISIVRQSNRLNEYIFDRKLSALFEWSEWQIIIEIRCIPVMMSNGREGIALWGYNQRKAT